MPKPVLGIRGGYMPLVCYRRFGETNDPDTRMSPMEQKAGKIAMETIASDEVIDHALHRLRGDRGNRPADA